MKKISRQFSPLKRILKQLMFQINWIETSYSVNQSFNWFSNLYTYAVIAMKIYIHKPGAHPLSTKYDSIVTNPSLPVQK